MKVGRTGTTVIGLICLSMALSGCYAQFALEPEELVKLDGFRAGDMTYLRYVGGRNLVFTEGTTLVLITQGGRRFEENYWSISVKDGIFRGETTSGARVTIPLDEMDWVGLRLMRVGRTVVVVILVVLGAAILFSVYAP